DAGRDQKRRLVSLADHAVPDRRERHRWRCAHLYQHQRGEKAGSIAPGEREPAATLVRQHAGPAHWALPAATCGRNPPSSRRTLQSKRLKRIGGTVLDRESVVCPVSSAAAEEQGIRHGLTARCQWIFISRF